MISEVKKKPSGYDHLTQGCFMKVLEFCLELFNIFFNIILATGNCSATWQHAVATASTKVSQSTAYKVDLQPIYVTPILSKLSERPTVHEFFQFHQSNF